MPDLTSIIEAKKALYERATLIGCEKLKAGMAELDAAIEALHVVPSVSDAPRTRLKYTSPEVKAVETPSEDQFASTKDHD